MTFIKGIGRYTIVVIIGVFLAFFVAWIQYDSSDLSASVLSLTEQNFFESTKWDAGYKKENQIFEVFLAEQVRNDGELMVSIIYSPTDIERFINEINTNCSVGIVQQNKGNLILNVNGYESLDFNEGIFELPYSGNSEGVTLEYIRSKDLNFAIGNLDNIEKNQTH